MSHFAILVFDKNVEEALAPFDENMSVEPYVLTTPEKAAAKRLKQIQDFKATLASPQAEENYNVPYIQERIKALSAQSDEDYYKEEISGYDLNSEGFAVTTYNPNSKWDWYTEGGRWSPYFLCKDGTKRDKAMIKEIDLAKMRAEIIQDLDENWKSYQEHPFKTTALNTKEEYLKHSLESVLVPYSYVYEGKWIAKGKMRMFGVSDEGADSASWTARFWQFWQSLPDTTVVTMVDCHI